MSEMIQKVDYTGTLLDDPSIRNSLTGNLTCWFTLCHDDFYGGPKNIYYLSFCARDKLAIMCKSALKKGMCIKVSGTFSVEDQCVYIDSIYLK
jgi:hypothetical protein